MVDKGDVNRQFNIDGTYSGAYADMVRVPRSTLMFMMNSAQQVIPSINAHVVANNVAKARKNANDSALYSHYMNRARLYKKYTINNPDVDSRIRQSLTDPALKEIDKKLGTMRTRSGLLTTTVGMKQYQKLIIARKKRFAVLQNDERERYHKFINNPSSKLADSEPRSMKDVPYHSDVTRSFLSRYPDVIQSDPSHNLYIEGKKVSDDPEHEGCIIHYLTHDYADIHAAPHGSFQLVDAMLKRGFHIDDFGNKYLREHMIRQHNGGAVKQEISSPHPPTTPKPAASVIRRRLSSSSTPIMSSSRYTPHPPTTPKPAHQRPRTPVSPSARGTPATSRQILRYLKEYRV